MPPYSALHFKRMLDAESYQFPSCAIANESDKNCSTRVGNGSFEKRMLVCLSGTQLLDHCIRLFTEGL